MNNFIWTDLSTFDLEKTKQFYNEIFGWNYYQSDDQYHVGYTGNFEASGLYEMPEKFQKMNMPSFWMSYIQVENVAETVAIAKKANGIIEVVEDLESFGKIALIRDPLGAGFTIYEGNQLNSRTEDTENTLVWNELFASDASLVIPFYSAIFNWKITYEGYGRYVIENEKGETVSAIQQLDNSIKGKHEYWGVFFKVKDFEQAKLTIINNGGTIVFAGDTYALCTDSFNAMFHITT